MVLRGSKFAATCNGEEAAGRFSFDPTAKTIEFRTDEGFRLIVAVYALDGDTLRVCWAANDQRPKAVAGGKGLTVATYMRKN